MRKRTWQTSLAIVAATLCGSALQASTFKTITIDDVYDDWVGVPVINSDGGDNQGGPDIGDTQIANDGNYLYVRNSFANNLSLGTFITVDVDENVATGFDVFGLGLVGSEAGWQNDFPFTQATGTFNDGVGMSGEFFGSGAALLAPFGNAANRELAISLDIVRNGGGGPIFPDDTITLLVWTDLGVGPDGTFDGFNGDVSAVIRYTLAVPEPSALVLAGIGIICFGRLGRRNLVGQ